MCTAYFQIINFTLFTLYSWNDWQDALQGSVMQKRPTWSHFQMSLLSAILPCECPMVWVTELQDQEAREAALVGCPVSPSHSNSFHHCVPLFITFPPLLPPFFLLNTVWWITPPKPSDAFSLGGKHFVVVEDCIHTGKAGAVSSFRNVLLKMQW